MRRFIVKVLLFALSAVLVAGTLELLVRQIPNSYRQKYEWMSRHGVDVQTLVLGNSHGLFGIRPDLLGMPAYNLCNVSQTFEYDDYLLRHFCPSCRQLKTVILIVDHSNFFDPLLEDGEAYRCTYYRLYMHYPKHSLLSRYGLEVSDFHAVKEKVLNWYEGKSAPCDSLGWNGSYRKEDRNLADLTKEAARKTVLRHHEHGLKYVGANTSALLRIAAFCRQHRLRLILLETPVLPAYSEAVRSEDQAPLQQVLQQTLQLCQDSYGAVVVDFSTDSRFNEADFFDADHLNSIGAEKLSRLLSTH